MSLCSFMDEMDFRLVRRRQIAIAAFRGGIVDQTIGFPVRARKWERHDRCQ